MKILYHHRVLSRDGQDVHIVEMIAALRRQGHEVVIVAPPATQGAEFGSDGGFLSWLRSILPRAVSELLELIYSVPDYFRLRAAWRKQQPDILYERHNLFLLSGYWLKRRTGIPYLLEVNAPLFEERATHGGLALHGVARATERRVWKAAEVVLPVTQVLADILETSGVQRSKLTVIPNGVDLPRFSPSPETAAVREELGIRAPVVLGFTGFMREWHDLDRVARLLAEPWAAELHLLIVGDGPGRGSLEAEAKRSGVSDRVTIMGIVDRDRVNRYVNAFDIALQPRVVEYASPLKLFEYMALGLAIVAPDTPNIREVLTDNDNALLFPLKDDQAFSRRLRQLVTDSDLRRSLGQRARQTIIERPFTWDHNAERVMALAAQLCASDHR
jgi:glycosyltransferase involved in cell wall biosynthesis